VKRRQSQLENLALTLNDSVDGTRLLAESTVDTLGHVEIVSRCSPRSIFTSLRFDRNGLSGADSFAKLTSWLLALVATLRVCRYGYGAAAGMLQEAIVEQLGKRCNGKARKNLG